MKRDPIAGQMGLEHMLSSVRRAPWRFGFIALMRRFGATYKDAPRIGLANRPQQEHFRLGQSAALTFAPREIAELALPSQEHAPGEKVGLQARPGNNPSLPTLRLYGLGMLGPNGPLPLHYSEAVRERSENHGDHTLANFLDIFHHRFLTHMYRAWSQSQAAAGLDRADDETFSHYIAHLTGHDLGEIEDSVLPSHARMAASTHLARGARNPDELAQTLARFFGVPVRLEEFVMHWIRVDEEDQTHIGRARMSSVMGVGAMAGEVVADRQNKFRLVLGPLQLKQYLRFTPRGEDLPLLVEWVRAFVGFEFEWDVELRVRNDSAPPARLDESERLGWSTWLGGGSPPTPGAAESQPTVPDAAPDYAVGMVFEPERYVGAMT